MSTWEARKFFSGTPLSGLKRHVWGSLSPVPGRGTFSQVVWQVVNVLRSAHGQFLAVELGNNLPRVALRARPYFQ